MNGLGESFDDGLQSWHPRKRQVTVLEKNPATLNFGVFNKSLGLLSLTLSKRDHFSLGPHSLFLGKCLKVLNGISTSTKNENQRRDIRRILIARLNLKSGRIYELFANLFNNVILDSLTNLIGSYSLEYDHLLE